MSEKNNHNETDLLILKLIENHISDSELHYLEQWFATHPEAIQSYCEFITNYAAMKIKFNSEIPNKNESTIPTSFDNEAWTELSYMEKTAEAVEIEKPLPPAASKPVEKLSSRKTNKLSLFTLIFSAAALFCLIAYIHLMPSTEGKPVATLLTMMDARWDDPQVHLESGDRLFTQQDSLFLTGGMLEIRTDQGVTFVVEGPAKFQIKSVMDVQLSHGRLFARVSKQGTGFTVSTETAKIIDLGTEFGVQVDGSGQTELHVIRGKTTLIAGRSEMNKVTEVIEEGFARSVSQDGTKIRKIEIKQQAFARAFNAETKTVWYGEKALDLADIICKGNGFGTGSREIVLDPIHGKFLLKDKAEIKRHSVSAEKHYLTVPEAAYIDGIFIPNGKYGPVQITSEKHTYDACPVTTGTFHHYISNGPFNWDEMLIYGNDGQLMNAIDKPSIYLHSNLGITFDLQKIRNDLPDLKITEFETRCVLEIVADKLLNSDSKVEAGCIILLDGKEQFRCLTLDQGRPIPVRIQIGPTDRFLTLLAVDVNGNISGDRTYYMNPQLHITE